MKVQYEQALLFLKKAKEDEALLDEVIESEKVSNEIFGFHCQQSAEKSLKALLSALAVEFRKTHDLRELLDLLLDNAWPIPPHLSDIDVLTPYGTFFRYGSLDEETPFDRESAMKLVQELREWIEKEVNKLIS